MQIIAQHIKEEDYPSTDDIASYAEALKLYVMEGEIQDKELVRLVSNLPEPNVIRKRLSDQEARILFQTIGYVWKKITKKSIIEDSKVMAKPDTLEGNYWLLAKGILLNGVNHYSIIKQNFELFRTLLGINAFAMHEKLAAQPNELIKLILDHGGLRVFVSKDKRAYFQLTDETYSKWGGKKIRKYAFKKKMVKLLDKTRPYRGWESGIYITI